MKALDDLADSNNAHAMTGRPRASTHRKTSSGTKRNRKYGYDLRRTTESVVVNIHVFLCYARRDILPSLIFNIFTFSHPGILRTTLLLSRVCVVLGARAFSRSPLSVRRRGVLKTIPVDLLLLAGACLSGEENVHTPSV